MIPRCTRHLRKSAIQKYVHPLTRQGEIIYNCDVFMQGVEITCQIRISLKITEYKYLCSCYTVINKSHSSTRLHVEVLRAVCLVRAYVMF